MLVCGGSHWQALAGSTALPVALALPVRSLLARLPVSGWLVFFLKAGYEAMDGLRQISYAYAIRVAFDQVKETRKDSWGKAFCKM